MVKEGKPAVKIGIISMQRVQNYGSFMQAYGLKKTLESMGHEVVFLDYKPGKPIVPYSRIERLKYLIKNTPIVNAINDYTKYYLLNHKEFVYEYRMHYLRQLGISYLHNYHDKVDLAIIGSDEVFNCMQDGPNVGFSPMLFGQNINAKMRISYAASFGYTTYEKIKQENIASQLSKWLGEFEQISVRDNNSCQIVEKLTGRKPALHLDPVLISEYSIPTVVPDEEKYAILYTYKSRHYSEREKEEIRSFCRKNDLVLVSIGNAQDWVDKKIMLSPLEMLGYFQKANFVITDTFHGTVFSVKTNRRFATMIRDDNSNKLKDLLDRLGLSDRQIHEMTSQELQAKYEAAVNYNIVNAYLETERKNTINYLETCISKAGSTDR